MKRETFLEKKSRILAAMALKAKIQQDPGLEPTEKKKPGRWIYYFNQKYTYIEGPELILKTDAEVSKLLKDYPTKEEMAITAAYLTGIEPILPSSLKNHPDVKIIDVGSAADLANRIYMETNVPVDSTKLSDAKYEAWLKLPLNKKIEIFNKGIEQEKKDKAEVARIVECLKLNDSRRRKECLNNCKTK